MKETSKWESLAEWCLLILIVSVVMGMGAARVHQLKLNLFLVGSYVAIVILMASYRVIYRRWFSKEKAPDAKAEAPSASGEHLPG